MKIALAGKGGSGKTTLAGLLARDLARRGYPVWAIDADTNPNLGLTLGLPRERLLGLQPLPRSILKERTDEAGKRTMTLGMPPREVAGAFGTPTPDGVTLLLMGTVDHAGAG
jgi:CO dehydrogenase maturation factor